MNAIRLRTEYLRDPMGIDIQHPRLFWNDEGGVRQMAYQIATEQWDSGRVESASMHADYPLPLATAYPVYSWQRTIGGVRIEHSVEADEIVNAKTMVEEARSDMGNTILIYSLDKENINRYSHDTYQKIYRHR